VTGATRSTIVAFVVAGLCLLAPVATQAATRYAEPNGDNTATCPETDPCDIEEAVEDATNVGNGDEIVLLPGTYDTATGLAVHGLDITKNVTIHGRPGEPRPVIRLNDGAEPTVEITTATSATLRDLRIEAAAAGQVGLADTSQDLTAARVQVLSAGTGVLLGGTSALRSSVVRSTGASGAAVRTINGADATLLGDTMYADGTGLHIIAGANASTATGQNDIVHGGDKDIKMDASGAGVGSATLDYSNFDIAKVQLALNTELNEGGHNQAAPPVFQNAAGGDLHQTSASPTVNAGVADVNTPLDFESESRSGTPDIGGDEFHADTTARHAAPNAVAVGRCGTAASACRLKLAVEDSAGSDDEVVVHAGEHDLTSGLAVGRPLDIHAAPGPRPLVIGNTGASLVTFGIGTPGAMLRGLAVEQLGGGVNSVGISTIGGVTMDRVVAVTLFDNAEPMSLTGGDVVKNSVAFAQGDSTAAIFASGTGTATLRNVTAVTAPSTASDGILVQPSFAGTLTIAAHNSIASAGASDLHAAALDAGAHATIEVDHSLYGDTNTTGP